MMDHETVATKGALDRLLKWVRDLAEFDTVKPDDGMYHTMQYVAQALAGLRSAVHSYDETVAYFADKTHNRSDKEQPLPNDVRVGTCEACCAFGDHDVVVCYECYINVDLERASLAKELLEEKKKSAALELVFEAVGWPCHTCDTEPRVTALSKHVYCGTPCEDERAYDPQDWIAKQQKALEEGDDDSK